jgi:hypothetical protein
MPLDFSQFNFKPKNCKTCGDSFKPPSGVAKYCQPQCQLMANVLRAPSGCLEFTGHKDKNGYGSLIISGRINIRAHRLSYSCFKGPVPSDMLVCHSCDNPSCVEPSHLFLGDSSDNKNDSVRKGRNVRGERSPSAILNSSQVLAIRQDTRDRRFIAADYGISRAAVDDVRSGKSWGWLVCDEVA